MVFVTAPPLRILHVEDLPADAELAERELVKAGITFEIRRVETQEAFLAGSLGLRPGPDPLGLPAADVRRDEGPAPCEGARTGRPGHHHDRLGERGDRRRVHEGGRRGLRPQGAARPPRERGAVRLSKSSGWSSSAVESWKAWTRARRPCGRFSTRARTRRFSSIRAAPSSRATVPWPRNSAGPFRKSSAPPFSTSCRRRSRRLAGRSSRRPASRVARSVTATRHEAASSTSSSCRFSEKAVAWRG